MLDRSRPWKQVEIIKDALSRKLLVLSNNINGGERNNTEKTAKQKTKMVLTLIIFYLHRAE